MKQAQDRGFLLRANIGIVVGMAVAQDLDHMRQGPFLQAAEIGPKLGLRRQGARAGPLHRPADPQAGARGRKQRVAAQAAVAQDAIAGPPVRHLQRGPQA